MCECVKSWGKENVGNVLCDYLKSDNIGKEPKKGAEEDIGFTHFTQ